MRDRAAAGLPWWTRGAGTGPSRERVVLALVAGAVIGVALGALGGGGSVLAVPALIYLLGFTPVAATTAGLVIVTVTSATALSAHARDGHVRWRTVLLFAAAGTVPAMPGGALAGRLPAGALTAAFAVVAGTAALRMLRPRAASDTAVPVRPERAAAAGAGLGAVTGVLGVGGGFLAVPALVSVLGMPMRDAVGTSLLVITGDHRQLPGRARDARRYGRRSGPGRHRAFRRRRGPGRVGRKADRGEGVRGPRCSGPSPWCCQPWPRS